MNQRVSDILRTIASNFAELHDAIEDQQNAMECEIRDLRSEVSRNREAIKAAANAMLGMLE